MYDVVCTKCSEIRLWSQLRSMKLLTATVRLLQETFSLNQAPGLQMLSHFQNQYGMCFQKFVIALELRLCHCFIVFQNNYVSVSIFYVIKVTISSPKVLLEH